jgi:hypothetical protein
MKRRIDILRAGPVRPVPAKTSADYKYNKDLRLNYVRHDHRFATFNCQSGETHCIIQGVDDNYIVASFHPDGRCSNAQSHLTHFAAWKHFDELREEPGVEPFETPIDYDNEFDLDQALSEI